MNVDTVFRVAFVYFVLMAAFRVIGKRAMGELSPFDFVTLLLIPELFSDALARDDFSMTNATVGVMTLLTLVFLTSVLSFRFRGVDRVLGGEPTVLVHDGRFLERHMSHERVTPEDVIAEVHKAGLEELRQVRWAILEVDGHIAIVPAGAAGLPVNRRLETATA